MFNLPVNNSRTVYWEIGKRGTTEFEEVPDGYLDQAKDRDAGVYFTVNQLGDKRNAKGHLRHKENVTHLLACFTDFDSGTKEEQMTRIRSFLAPTCLVESGRGYHAYFEFKAPVEATLEAIKVWTHIQKSLASRLGGDKACSDTARLMRYPGSWHVKSGFTRTRVKVIEHGEHRYSLEYLLSLFEPEKKVFYLKKSTYSPRKYPLIPELLLEGERHAALLRTAGSLFRGVAPIEIDERMNMLKAWYVASSKPLKDNWEEEVEDVVKWVTEQELYG